MTKKILAVEDNTRLLGMYARFLSAPGRAVSGAESVAKAESLIGQNVYDLLITDLMLPDGLGTELIELLEKKGAGTKSLIISGSLTPEVTRRARGPNFLGCLEKPVNLNELLVVVEKALV